jgi:hypothetical protein
MGSEREEKPGEERSWPARPPTKDRFSESFSPSAASPSNAGIVARRVHWLIHIAIIGVVGVVVGYVILVMLDYRWGIFGPPTPGPVPTTSNTTVKITITSPQDGIEVSGRAGMLIKGTAFGLQNESVRLFEYDPEVHIYYWLYGPGPTVTPRGTWEFLDRPIGYSGNDDIGKTYMIIAVRASNICDATLLRELRDQGHDFLMHELPRGCTVDDILTVVKARP